MKKQRLDLLLVEQGHAPSREKAKALIMAGSVYIGTEVADKPGMLLPTGSVLRLKGETLRYVSRGGYKLEKAIAVFGIDVHDHVVLDIGASTGGFTDCALQHGARYVYAVDVGHNQLAWSLRSDERVCVMEKTNFRTCSPERFEALPPTFIVADVSFISLRLLAPSIVAVLPEGASFVGLIKPQFETQPRSVGKQGVVALPKVHREVLLMVVAALAHAGLALIGVTYSPITGGAGNIEFIGHWVKATREISFDHARRWAEQSLHEVVAEAHRMLG